jgi:hypothetical protein
MSLDRLSQQEYDLAYKQAVTLMRERASRKRLVTYKEISQYITACNPRLDPHFEVGALVGYISQDECEAGRGMLSAIVVREDDQTPGLGFYVCARELGLPVRGEEDLALWVEQLNLVYRTNARA